MGPAGCRWTLVALIALQPLWYCWLATPQLMPPGWAVALTATPLLVALPFVWRLRKTALVMTGCLLMLYFCIAVSETWVDPVARVPAIAQVILIVIYFIALSSLRFGRDPQVRGSGTNNGSDHNGLSD